eukprot:SAG11_NODE_912_length_6580_cov_2.243018_3_plen_171_part_00
MLLTISMPGHVSNKCCSTRNVPCYYQFHPAELRAFYDWSNDPDVLDSKQCQMGFQRLSLVSETTSIATYSLARNRANLTLATPLIKLGFKCALRSRTQQPCNHGRTGRGTAMDDDATDDGTLFATRRHKELKPLKGTEPPLHYHSLLVELGERIHRYREFVVFHGDNIYS